MASLPGILTRRKPSRPESRSSWAEAVSAEIASPAVVKALLAVLPKGTKLIPVGGIGADNMQAWRSAGAAGFGLGSSLYKAGDDAATVRAKAASIVGAWRK